MKEYTGATYTKAEDMQKCYKLALLLNPKLSKECYKAIIDKITRSTNYVQHVVLQGDTPVSMCATQDTLNMGVAPKLSCKIDQLATLPEHRGTGVTKVLMNCVEDKFRDKGYDNLDLCVSKGNTAEQYYRKAGFSDKFSLNFKKKLLSGEDKGKTRSML